MSARALNLYAASVFNYIVGQCIRSYVVLQMLSELFYQPEISFRPGKHGVGRGVGGFAFARGKVMDARPGGGIVQ